MSNSLFYATISLSLCAEILIPKDVRILHQQYLEVHKVHKLEEGINRWKRAINIIREGLYSELTCFCPCIWLAPIGMTEPLRLALVLTGCLCRDGDCNPYCEVCNGRLDNVGPGCIGLWEAGFTGEIWKWQLTYFESTKISFTVQTCTNVTNNVSNKEIYRKWKCMDEEVPKMNQTLTMKMQ